MVFAASMSRNIPPSLTYSDTHSMFNIEQNCRRREHSLRLRLVAEFGSAFHENFSPSAFAYASSAILWVEAIYMYPTLLAKKNKKYDGGIIGLSGLVVSDVVLFESEM